MPLFSHMTKVGVVAFLTLAITSCGSETAVNHSSPTLPTTNNVPQVQQVGNGALFVEFKVPTASAHPNAITVGSDGNMWFVESSANKVARVTMQGSVTEHTIPTAASDPLTISPGASGYLWFTEYNTGIVARITTAGTFYGSYHTPTASSHPYGIVQGPDGNMWFTESTGNRIGKITNTGAITEYVIPTAASSPAGITVGPDKNLWFAETGSSHIGRITTGGTITQFAISGRAKYITAASDGALWYTDAVNNQVGRITTSGVSRVFSLGTGAVPAFITRGPDGNPWFAEQGLNALRHVDDSAFIVSGNLTVPTAASSPDGISSAPDGNVWFTEYAANKVGVYMFKRETVSPNAISFTALNQTQKLSVSETYYTGSFTAVSSNTAVATVSGSGSSFTVKAVGAGKCTVAIKDSSNNSTPVAVTVTTTGVIDQ